MKKHSKENNDGRSSESNKSKMNKANTAKAKTHSAHLSELAGPDGSGVATCFQVERHVPWKPVPAGIVRFNDSRRKTWKCNL